MPLLIELWYFKVCGDDVQKNVDVLPKMLEITTHVITRTHTVYEVHELHALP